MFKFSLVSRRALVNFAVNLLIYSVILVLYLWHPYYRNFLAPETKLVFQTLWTAYLLLGLPYYYWRFGRKIKNEVDYALEKVPSLIRFLKNLFLRRSSSPQQKKSAQVAALSYVVKIFFLPLMLNFFFGHVEGFLQFWQKGQFGVGSLAQYFWDTGYQLIFNLIFILDTVVFALAYTFEFDFLRNRIKSVDPFISGWVVALICYPPFNSVLDQYLPLAKGSAWITNSWLLGFSKIMVLFGFIFYVWATIALGLRAGNLSNRGIVKRGPYRLIRHPAYMGKNLAWWFEMLPFFTPSLALALIGWNIIYVLRALTEERHLRADPEYRRYQEEVKWRFIPRVF